MVSLFLSKLCSELSVTRICCDLARMLTDDSSSDRLRITILDIFADLLYLSKSSVDEESVQSTHIKTECTDTVLIQRTLITTQLQIILIKTLTEKWEYLIKMLNNRELNNDTENLLISMFNLWNHILTIFSSSDAYGATLSLNEHSVFLKMFSLLLLIRTYQSRLVWRKALSVLLTSLLLPNTDSIAHLTIDHFLHGLDELLPLNSHEKKTSFGFAGEVTAEEASKKTSACSAKLEQLGDASLLRNFVILMLKSLAKLSTLSDHTHNQRSEVILLAFKKLKHFVEKFVRTREIPVSFLGCLFVLFGDQDDLLIDTLLALHHLYLFLNCEQNHPYSVVLPHPHSIFFQLLLFVCFDHQVLLDFLISNETNFLEYLTSYLKFFVADSADIEKSSFCRESSCESVVGDNCSAAVTETIEDTESNSQHSRELLQSMSSEFLVSRDETVKLCDYSDSEEELSDTIVSLVANNGSSLASVSRDSMDVETALDHFSMSSSSSSSLDCGTETKLICPSELDKVLCVLNNLLKSIQRLNANGLFPYNVLPLITLLHSCVIIISDKTLLQ